MKLVFMVHDNPSRYECVEYADCGSDGGSEAAILKTQITQLRICTVQRIMMYYNIM